MRKTAAPSPGFMQGFKDTFKQPAVIASIAAPFVGFGIGQAEGMFRRRRMEQQKTDSYKQMLSLHPHLQQRDPGEVSRIFNSIHNVSPTMARDPMVAGAWVDNVIENRVPGMNSYQGLLNASKDLSQVEKFVTDARKIRKEPGPLGRLAAGATEGIGRGMQNARKELTDSYWAKQEADMKARETAHKATKDQDTEKRQAYWDARKTEQAAHNQRGQDVRDREYAQDKREAHYQQHVTNAARKMVEEMRGKQSSATELGRLFAALRV